MTATASSTKGTKICVVKGSAVSTALVPTAISKAAPAVVTVADVSALKAGDLISIPASTAAGAVGFPELADKMFPIGTVNAGAKTFTLVGSDTTASTGTLSALPSLAHYDENSFLCLCLSSIAFNPESANTVSVATFCDPTATIPSQVVGAGTIDIGGYVDITDPGYKELVAAEADGKARNWRVTLGNGQGYLLFSGIMSSLSLDLPIDGAVAFNGTVSLSSKYRHLF